MNEWREPTEWEHALLQAMLSIGFAGSDVYCEQATRALVREFDRDRQLEFNIDSEAPVASDPAFRHFALVEAKFVDADGVPGSFILHERDGRLDWLEKFKFDSSTIVRNEPPISDLTISLI